MKTKTITENQSRADWLAMYHVCITVIVILWTKSDQSEINYCQQPDNLSMASPRQDEVGGDCGVFVAKRLINSVWCLHLNHDHLSAARLLFRRIAALQGRFNYLK